MDITVQGTTFLDPVGAGGVHTLMPPPGLQVGDYLIAACIYGQGTGTTAIPTNGMTGWTTFFSGGESSHRAIRTYGYALVSQADIDEVNSGILFSTGPASSRFAAICAHLKGVNLAGAHVPAVSVQLGSTTQANFSTIPHDPLRDQVFTFTYDNVSANGGGPLPTALDGGVVAQHARSYATAVPATAASTGLTLTAGGSGITFDPPVVNSGSHSIAIMGLVEDSTPPSKVTGLVASNVSTNSAKLTWDPATDSGGIAGYRVYSGATMIEELGPVTTTTLSGLVADTEYSISVSAFDMSDNEGEQSDAITFSTSPEGDFGIRDFNIYESPGRVNVGSSSEPILLDLPDRQIGDVVLVAATYQTLYGNGTFPVPPGFTIVGNPGTANNRSLMLYARPILEAAHLPQDTIQLRGGSSSTRVAAVAMTLVGVDLLDTLEEFGDWQNEITGVSTMPVPLVSGWETMTFVSTNGAGGSGFPKAASETGIKIAEAQALEGSASTSLTVFRGSTSPITFDPAATNGGGFRVALRKKGAEPGGMGPNVKVSMYGEYRYVQSLKIDVDGVFVPVSVRPFYHKSGYTIDHLFSTDPFYIAHRGSGDNWPEHTMLSYTNSVKMGMKAIEVSCFRTQDDIFVCHHDPTTTRMTGVNHDIASTPWSTLQGLTNTADFTDNPTQTRQPIPLLSEVLDAYGETHVFFLEAKNGADTIALVDIITDIPNYQERFVWKQWAGSNAGVSYARSAGLKLWGYLDSGMIPDRLGEMADKFDYIGVNHSVSDSDIGLVIDFMSARDIPVIMWEIHTNADRNRAESLGIKGMMTSNIKAVKQKHPLG